MGFAGTQSVNANDAGAIAMDTDGAIHIADGGNSITIDGTVTADLGATDNAVLDAIAASLSILDDWDDSNLANVNLNLNGSDAPTGGGAESGALRVTIANDSTGLVSVDDGGGALTVDGTVTANLSATDNAVLDAMVVDLAAMEVLLTAANVDHAANEVLLGTIDADTNAIKTAVEIIDNAISGSEMQVDTVSTVQPAGHGAVAQFTTNIAGTATQLDAHACKHADVMGKIANVGIVYVGGSSVAATTGIALYPGDVYSVDVTNTNLLYGIAVNANDDLQVVYYN